MSIDNPATEKQKRILAMFGYSRTEMKKLSGRQANALLDYVRQNNRTDPNVDEQGSIEGGKLLEE